MAAVTVRHVCADRYWVETRGHVVVTDQPRANGVEMGPTPVELLVMALAACAAHYAVGYLREQGLPCDGLRVETEWTMRPDPPRIGRMELTVVPPVALDAELRAGMLAAVDRCTVHNTLREPPTVRIGVADEPAEHRKSA